MSSRKDQLPWDERMASIIVLSCIHTTFIGEADPGVVIFEHPAHCLHDSGFMWVLRSGYKFNPASMGILPDSEGHYWVPRANDEGAFSHDRFSH
jgi:hypothetical protein